MTDRKQRIAGLESQDLDRLLSRLRQSKTHDATQPSKRQRARVERDTYPLSSIQRRVWFLQELQPDNPSYSVALSFRLTGPLSPEALQQSLQTLVRRHTVFRTYCKDGADGPVQAIADAAPIALCITDLSAFPEARREEAVQKYAAEEVGRVVPLDRAPLLRVRLFRLDQDHHAFVLVTHHFACDGWAMAMLCRELEALYAAYASGEQHAQDEPTLRYVDFAVEQDERLAAGGYERESKYWGDRLAGMSGILEVPTDFPRPQIQRYVTGSVHRSIPARLAEQLREIGAVQATTLFVVMLSAFKILLHRYTGQRDVVVGTAASLRSESEWEQLVGCFMNNLVLRTDLGEDQTVRETVAAVKDTVIGAFAHQDMPFEKLVEQLRPARDLSRSPVFQVLFVFINMPRGSDGTLKFGPVDARRLGVEDRVVKMDIEVYFRDDGAGLKGELVFDSKLYKQETMERFFDHYLTVLRSMDAVDTPIARVDLLSEKQRDRVLRQWNARTQYETGRPSAIAQFEERVRSYPDAAAVVFEDSTISYKQLNDRAQAVANRLAALGVDRGGTVAIFVERSPEMLYAVLGTLKTCAAFLPLDVHLPAPRIAYMLEDAQPDALVSGGTLAAAEREGIETLCREASCPVLDIDERDLESDRTEAVALKPPEAADLAYVIYTSGSTGRPKPVAISHGALSNFLNAIWDDVGFAESDVLLSVTTISFDIAMLELFLPLVLGGRVAIAPRAVTRDGALLARELDRTNATVMQATPATWRMLVEAGWEGRAGLTAWCGGEALPPELAAELLPRTKTLWNLYGPTETTIWSTAMRITSVDGPLPIGLPLRNGHVYVLTPSLTLAPPGVVGELYIGGNSVAEGYPGHDDLTAERFLADPFSPNPAARMYRTGDLVTYDDSGVLHFHGRADQQVKVRGVRIEPAEIERALVGLDSVRDALVVAVNQAAATTALAAYIIEKPGASVSPGELRTALLRELPESMVPSYFVTLPAFPMTPNGKIDRNALPKPTAALARKAARPPRNDVERTLESIWSDVLEVRPIGVNDNFFELGGHSLLVPRICTRVHDALDVDMQVTTLFHYPTIASLAAALANGSNETNLRERANERAGKRASSLEQMRARRRQASDVRSVQ